MLAVAILFIALGLDTFAVSISLGIANLPRVKWLRVGLTFAAFEGIMPVIGLIAGAQLAHALQRVAQLGSGAILIVIGLFAIKEAISGKEKGIDTAAVEGPRLLLTGLSVSLDELAVGFSLGAFHAPIGLSLAYIVTQALVVTFAGLAFGKRIGERVGERAELLSGGGLAILGIAVIVGALAGARWA